MRNQIIPQELGPADPYTSYVRLLFLQTLALPPEDALPAKCINPRTRYMAAGTYFTVFR